MAGICVVFFEGTSSSTATRTAPPDRMNSLSRTVDASKYGYCMHSACDVQLLCPGISSCSQYANSPSYHVSCTSSSCEFVTTHGMGQDNDFDVLVCFIKVAVVYASTIFVFLYSSE